MSSQPNIVGYCRACGKALDESTVRAAQGTIYCAEHLPQPGAETSPYTAPASAPSYASPYTAPVYSAPPSVPGSSVSPALAFILGFIPGVGAIYNGQYVKGLVHVIILGLLISIESEGGSPHALLGLLIFAFWMYMPFEAYHTAIQRRVGNQVDDFSSLMPLHRGSSRVPVGPVALIVLGVIFLLENLGLLDLHRIMRFWPVLLIALGAYLLYARITDVPRSDTSRSGGER